MSNNIDEKTKAIVVCNPSNPCGSVYSKEHLTAILEVAEKHKVPIIADEIYRNLVFSDVEFHALGELSKNVPVLATGGLAKEFLVPGWRVGWVVVHDRNGVFAEVRGSATVRFPSVPAHVFHCVQIRTALMKLSQLILGANSLVQAAIPAVLTPPENSPEEEALSKFHKDLVQLLE
ncbi:Tat, partial [Symbiodinium sp. KB8]